MTSIVPHRWREKEVRRLLRGLRGPHVRENEPLALVLCETYELSDPYTAVVRVIDETFVNKGLVGKKLHNLIQRSDIDETRTQAGVAYEMNLSPRQFFRYRREAITALAAHINDLLDRPEGT